MLSTVDLLVLTSLDHLLLLCTVYFFKTSCLNEEVNGTKPSLSVSVAFSDGIISKVVISIVVVLTLKRQLLCSKINFTTNAALS